MLLKISIKLSNHNQSKIDKLIVLKFDRLIVIQYVNAYIGWKNRNKKLYYTAATEYAPRRKMKL